MDAPFTDIGMAFLQGLALNPTTSILPVLLIILSGSFTGNNKRPLGIALGFVIVFACFTLFTPSIVENTGLDLDIYRLCAFILIGLFGVLMFSDHLHEKFNHFIQVFVGTNEKNLTTQRNSFVIGLLLGTLVAIAWAPTSSSLLNTVIVQTIIKKVSLNTFFILFVFALGTILPTLFIIILFRTIITNNAWLKQNSHLIHKICGLIIIVSISFMARNYTYSASFFTTSENGESIYQATLINGLSKPYPAPDIDGITNWINTPPLTKDDLRGKTVLVYFWTYSCIHCMHALPYIINWHNNYHDNGLLIIGVHTPEFDFEKNLQNVKNAVANSNIPFAVAIDNNFVTWQNFHNKNWPSYYLIDKNGNVVYEYVGEGDYTTMENNIRFLLGFNKISEATTVDEHSPLLTAGVTPETHLGIEHTQTYAGLTPLNKDSTQEYSFPPSLKETTWALSGKWSVFANNITSVSNNAAIKIRFHSKQIFAIMGSHNKQKIAVKVLLDDKAVGEGAGNDMTDSIITVTRPRLYEILNLDKPMSGELQLIVPEGLELYTFSFDDT